MSVGCVLHPEMLPASAPRAASAPFRRLNISSAALSLTDVNAGHFRYTQRGLRA